VGRDAEQALLEDGVLGVPEGGGKDEDLVAVAEAGDAVLAPAVGLGAGQVVRQVGPGVAVGGIILTDGSPGTVGNVRPPAPPGVDVVGDLGEAAVFLGRHGESGVRSGSVPFLSAITGRASRGLSDAF